MAHSCWRPGDAVEGYVTGAPGLAVIITNDYSNSPLSTLKGTTADGNKMEKAFRDFFKFDCLRAKNLSGDDIRDLIAKTTHCPSVRTKKCIVFVFSGHGGGYDSGGFIYGEVDKDDEVNINDDILLAFDPQMAPGLENVPKLFFIDACRGTEDTKTSGMGKSGGKGAPQEASKGGGDASGVDSGDFRPVSGGYIIGYATMSGYKSYLRSDSEAGSVWMPLLADELQRDPERDVLHVLLYVNARLKEEFELASKRIAGFHYQQPHFENTISDTVNLFRISGLKESKAMKRPTFPELICVKKPDGTELRVMDHISTLRHAHIIRFGHKLLNDRLRVNRIERENRDDDDDEMLIHEIFNDWLSRNDSDRRDPAFPRTWRALAHCLEEVTDRLGVLVDDIRKYFD